MKKLKKINPRLVGGGVFKYQTKTKKGEQWIKCSPKYLQRLEVQS